MMQPRYKISVHIMHYIGQERGYNQYKEEDIIDIKMATLDLNELVMFLTNYKIAFDEPPAGVTNEIGR